MLFSERNGHWKLADFGTATKATSKRLHTTRYARGTTCYRAPELLQEDARVNNKADMFALGCILYEVTTGQKLFPDDWNIREYAMKGEPVFPNSWPKCEPESRLSSLGELAQLLLEVDPFSRPSAVETDGTLQLIRHGKVLPLGNLNCNTQERVTLIRQPSLPRNITVTQVQYRHSVPSFQALPMPQPPYVERRAPTSAELIALQERAASMGGYLKHPISGGYHSLYDYQSQLMFLELQQKRTLQKARALQIALSGTDS